jgi:hypothetical protein
MESQLKEFISIINGSKVDVGLLRQFRKLKLFGSVADSTF